MRIATTTDRLTDSLHSEALLLADEANGYFGGGAGRAERDALDPRGRVLLACEAMKATTRLMQLSAWLAARRGSGVAGGEPLAPAAVSDEAVLARLPSGARRLILAGIELHQRVGRLAAGDAPGVIAISPARSLLGRLERAF